MSWSHSIAVGRGQRLRAYRDGDVLELVVFRGDELVTTSVELASPPEDTCFLTLAADAGEVAESRRNGWLQNDRA